jgi:hypothetical protein
MMRKLFWLIPLLAVFAALLFSARVSARPLAQEPTPYEVPTDFVASPNPYIETPYDVPGQATLTPATGSGPSATPSPTASPSPVGFIASPTLPQTPTQVLTPSASPTLGRNLFGTEDAEMAQARLTPGQSETPSPSGTPSPSVTATPLAAEEGFNLNRGWFTAGILLPPFLLLGSWLILRARKSGEFG